MILISIDLICNPLWFEDLFLSYLFLNFIDIEWLQLSEKHIKTSHDFVEFCFYFVGIEIRAEAMNEDLSILVGFETCLTLLTVPKDRILLLIKF